MEKTISTPEQAVSVVKDGDTVMISGFGLAGQPTELIDALIQTGARHLTVVNNNAGNGETGLAALLKARQVDKMICSFPRQSDSYIFDELYRAGEIKLEVIPQGNLAERIRAAGAGIGGFYTPTGVGTKLAEGAETRTINGKEYILNYPLPADVALIKAHRADPVGNLTFRKTGRNFGPLMAAAAKHTIAQVSELVALGSLDPEAVVTPGIYVDTIVPTPAVAVDTETPSTQKRKIG